MGAPRQQGILNLAIKDKSALYSAYMPFVKNGGLFIPTNKPYLLGDEVFILLQLMESPERLPVGLQLTGRLYEEGVLLRVGDAYERQADWSTRQPPPAA